MKCYRRFSSTAVWQKWRFRSPQTILWLIKHWFSADNFVVKIATFAKPETERYRQTYDDSSNLRLTARK
jgi:hypothetical protein